MKRNLLRASLVCAISLLWSSSLLSPAWALPVLDMRLEYDGQGTRTYWFSISTLPEESVLDLEIVGEVNQVLANSRPYEDFGPEWAPNVFFTSDQDLANVFDADYAETTNNGALDTVIDDQHWAARTLVDLGPTGDGIHRIHVTMMSDAGGPLPGGYIPLARVVVTHPGHLLYISGTLRSESDPDGSFYCVFIPEPSTALLASLGACAAIVRARRRRQKRNR